MPWRRRTPTAALEAEYQGQRLAESGAAVTGAWLPWDRRPPAAAFEDRVPGAAIGGCRDRGAVAVGPEDAGGGLSRGARRATGEAMARGVAEYGTGVHRDRLSA